MSSLHQLLFSVLNLHPFRCRKSIFSCRSLFQKDASGHCLPSHSSDNPVKVWHVSNILETFGSIPQCEDRKQNMQKRFLSWVLPSPSIFYFSIVRLTFAHVNLCLCVLPVSVCRCLPRVKSPTPDVSKRQFRPWNSSWRMVSFHDLLSMFSPVCFFRRHSYHE